MTLTMTQVERIRILADDHEMSQRAIARELGISRDTVKKYLDADDFSPQRPPAKHQPGAKVLGAHLQAVIEAWLEQDLARPRKQRHTAKRIFDRLVDEYGYQHSYNPVHRFVKTWKDEHRAPSKGFAPRVPIAGTAEVDFGQAEVIIAGEPVTAHMLAVSFPYSNMRFGQLFYGETAECVVTGLMNICDLIGGVPHEMVFDNATGIGRRICDKVITSELFSRFRVHYRTKARFCNPASGHEKGNVENAVGFLRRNLLVPVPQGTSLKELNDAFFTGSIRFGDEIHYRHKVAIKDLFDADKQALLSLPTHPFMAVTYRNCVPDKTGVITIDNNRYLVGPSFARRKLLAEVSADLVTVLDEKHHPILSLPRRFGTHPELVYSPASLLPLLKVKPGAWAQSPIRKDIPDILKQWLDQAEQRQRKDMFTALNRATANTSFTSAVQAATKLIAGNHTVDSYSLDMLARRINDGYEIPSSHANLTVYDTLTSRTTPVARTSGDAA